MNKRIIFCDTATKLKDSIFQVGDVIQTLGYYEVGDGGAALYKIRKLESGDVDDNGAIHILLNGNVAELVITDNKVNIEVFGAKQDGSVCCADIFDRATKYCYEHGIVLSSNGGTYLIERDLIIDTCSVDFNYGTIKSNQKHITLVNDTNIWTYAGTDVTIFRQVKLYDTNLYTDSSAVCVEYLECLEWHESAINLGQVRYLDNVIFSNDRSDPNTVCVTVNATDKQISRLHGKGGFTGIVINAQNTVIRETQLWLSDKNRVNGTLDGSKFIHVQSGTGIMIDNCVSDTYQYAMYFDGNVINALVNNFQVINNNRLYHDCTMYLINKYVPIIGDVLIRMTHFVRDNIKFEIVSPCKLNIRWIDGKPEDITTYYESDLPNYIEDYDGNNIADKVEFANGSVIKINEGKMHIQLDITFKDPYLKDFRINTSKMAGINRVKGYSFIPAHYVDSEDIYAFATLTKGTNQYILIRSRSVGYYKRIACSVVFNLD